MFERIIITIAAMIKICQFYEAVKTTFTKF